MSRVYGRAPIGMAASVVVSSWAARRALIKDDHVRMKEYPPVVLSMNAGQDTFDSEIRKRALIVYTGASLPDHTGEARRLGRRVKQGKNNLGTALYWQYLKWMLSRLRQEREEPLDEGPYCCPDTTVRSQTPMTHASPVQLCTEGDPGA